MTREILFTSIVDGLHQGHIASVTSLVIEHNELAKSFDASQLAGVAGAFKVCKATHPIVYDIFEKNYWYQKNNVRTFISELPFASMAPLGFTRHFMPHKLGDPVFGVFGFPDAVDVNNITGGMQGIQFKNHGGFQNLPDLKFDTKYEILTSPQHVGSYQSAHPTARVYTHLDLPRGPNIYEGLNRNMASVRVAGHFSSHHGFSFGKFRV